MDSPKNIHSSTYAFSTTALHHPNGLDFGASSPAPPVSPGMSVSRNDGGGESLSRNRSDDEEGEEEHEQPTESATVTAHGEDGESGNDYDRGGYGQQESAHMQDDESSSCMCALSC